MKDGGPKLLPYKSQRTSRDTILKTYPDPYSLTNYILSSSKNKGLALKVDGTDDEFSDMDEEEAAMLVRKFKTFYKSMKSGDQKNKSFVKMPFNAKKTCHRCGDPNHFISDCPQRQNDKNKGKEQIWNNQQSFSKINFRKAMIAA